MLLDMADPADRGTGNHHSKAPTIAEVASLAGVSTLARNLTVVKVAKPEQDMRFDVPVIGTSTIGIMRRAGATCLALDARKCLLLDGDAILHAADDAGITIVADPA